MEILNLPKGSGKTSKLVELASENNCAIIVSSIQKKNKLKEYILYSPYSVNVYTVQEFIHGINGAKFSKADKICIDDMDEVLQQFIGFDIAYATCSIPYTTE